MSTVVAKDVKLGLLELAIAGVNTVELDVENVKDSVEYNSYLIESLARAIEGITIQGGVSDDEALTTLSCAEVIKFLSGLNAYLVDRNLNN